jgi:hypothetical protein
MMFIPDPNFSHPGSWIPDPNFLHPGSASKNLSILTPKKICLSSRKYDPRLFIPDSDPVFLPISRIPGVKKRIGSRICNTLLKTFFSSGEQGDQEEGGGWVATAGETGGPVRLWPPRGRPGTQAPIQGTIRYISISLTVTLKERPKTSVLYLY